MQVSNTVKLAMFEDPKYGDFMSLWAKLEAIAKEVVTLATTFGPAVVALVQEILKLIQGSPTPVAVTQEMVEDHAKKLGLSFNVGVITDVVALIQTVVGLVTQFGPQVWALIQKILGDLKPAA